MADNLHIEVAYALPEKQRILSAQVPEGTSIRAAVELSGIAKEFPDLDLAAAPLGIFGKAVRNADEPVKDGDRIEIYRPLLIDPKQARANRAAKAAEKAKKG